MTIASEITKLNTNLTNSYTACQNKGATMPANQNFDNLASTINSISGGSTPTGTLSITQNGTYDVTNYASADVNVSGGGGGSSNFDLPSNMKIIKATSMTISYNNTDIDIENLETGDDVLPFLIFCCPEDDVENATDNDYDLTGGFFLSFCGRSYGSNQQYSIGMNEGVARNTWYGKVFGVYQAGLVSLTDGSGSIECMEGGTSTISLIVTWDVP